MIRRTFFSPPLKLSILLYDCLCGTSSSASATSSSSSPSSSSLSFSFFCAHLSSLCTTWSEKSNNIKILRGAFISTEKQPSPVSIQCIPFVDVYLHAEWVYIALLFFFAIDATANAFKHTRAMSFNMIEKKTFKRLECVTWWRQQMKLN